MRTLLVFCILIGLAAVAAPHLFRSYLDQPASEDQTARESPPAEPQGAVDRNHARSDRRQVEIEAARDGHFYIDADINNRPVRLIVDTGATVVALRASDAASAGIRPVKSEFSSPVQTANGTTMAAEAVLDSVTVEDIELRHVRALVVPDDRLSISLLGGSFLNGLQRFQVAEGTLIFEN